MKKIVVKSLLVLPLLLIVAGVNTWIDPLHLISDRYYEKAGSLMAEHPVEYENCDDRKLMLEFLKHKKDAEMLVIGSSRTAIIDSTYTGAPILNLSLTSAAIEDMIAAYGAYLHDHKAPKKMLVGIEPYSFNPQRRRNTSAGFTLLPYYKEILEKMHYPLTLEEVTEDPLTDSRYLNVISFKYFQTSLMNIGKKGFGRKEPVVQYDNTNAALKDANGVLINRKGWQSNPADVDISVARDISTNTLLGINGFTEISKERVELLTGFLKYLKTQGVEVTLFLPPYHPTMWAHVKLKKYDGVILRSEKLIRDFASEEGMKVVGTFSPERYDLSSADYYDAVHLKHSGLKKIFFDVKP